MTSRLHIVEQKLKHISREKEGLRLWLRIVSCTQIVEQELRTMLREKFDMTPARFELLTALNRVTNGLTMGELSTWLMVTKGNVTGIAIRLSEDGYITRRPTPDDRRSFVVTLTKKGKQIVNEMELAYEQLLDQLFVEVSIDDSDTFTGVLAKVTEAIEEKRAAQEED